MVVTLVQLKSEWCGVKLLFRVLTTVLLFTGRAVLHPWDSCCNSWLVAR